MPVQSAYNVVVPLPIEGPPRYFALFNTLAGSIDILDQGIVDGLKTLQAAGPQQLLQIRTRTPRPAPLDDAVMGYLDRRGYLFESLDEERVQARLLYDEMLRFHREVVRQPLAIIPSYNCDLKCPYCWQRLYDMDSPIMSEETAERLFEALPQVLGRSPDQPVDVAIFGGEPLQDVPALRERVLQLLDLSNAAGFSTKIISNGVGLAAAAPHIAGRAESVQVTIDGPADVHRRRRPLPHGDSFTAMANGVDAALAHRIHVHVRVNVDVTNLPTLPALVDFARDRGWVDSGLVDFHLAPVKNHNPRKETNPEGTLLDEVLALSDRHEQMSIFDMTGFPGIKYFEGFQESGLFSLHRFFNCEAQINFFAFDLHGDIYACWDAAGIKDLSVGRFLPDVELYERRLNMWRKRTTLDIGGCGGCTSQPHCGGGCQFLALEHTSSFFSPNCDSMMEGYVRSIERNAAWLLERAQAGDHAVGLVTSDGVISPVEREFGLVETGGVNLAVNCG